MSVCPVPSSVFQMPLARPKRDHRTPEGLAVYTESVRLYDLEVARRWAYMRRGTYVYDDEDDVVVDVGGAGEPFVYPVARRLEDEMEEAEADEEDVVEDVYEGEYEVYSDDELEDEESSMKPMTYKLEQMTRTEFCKPMEQDCPVCLEDLKRADCVTTSCKHSFCATCYEKYPKKRTCPCCRQAVEMLTKYCVDYS